ncbi:Dynein light chain 1, axonemal [Phytophthora boehmeriae]|uniref:Dynein light chain 1, axonemal n=1 Tax=Phytophthora boehmeriae TaxID=109152 RepID=A0A8T1X2P5_9STRA|nr:Dynein light chain 1, axonemal [Phytophthora boehmeriae]
MLECTNCGAVGDSFFSTNFSGEMVCELCGTQSFQQARNETQDVEDMGIDVMRVSQMLKRQQPRKKRKGEGKLKPSEKRQTPTKQKPGDVELRDCLIATQTILDFQARTLVERVGVETFPPDYIRVVKELWFKFMETWGTKGEVPLLRCFTEFFLPNRLKEENCDPTITRDMLEQWDADREQKQAEQEQEERESEEKREDQSRTEETKAEDNEAVKKYEQDSIKSEGGKRRRKRRNMSQWKSADYTERLDKFSIMDLLGLLMLSSRVLNLGLLPSDFANWISTGVLPFHNLLATACMDAPDHVEGLRSQETKGDWRDDEKDPTYFYPKYTFSSQRRGAMHSAFENLLELLCQQIERDFKSLIRRRYDNPLPNLAIDAKWKTEPTDILAKKEEN